MGVGGDALNSMAAIGRGRNNMKLGRGRCFYPAILHKRGRGAISISTWELRNFSSEGRENFPNSLHFPFSELSYNILASKMQIEGGGFFKNEWEEGRHMLGTALTFFKKVFLPAFT